MKDGPASSFAIQLTPRGDSALYLPKTDRKQISSYVEAVNYLLKSYATDANIAKASPKEVNLRKAPPETSVQFSDVLRSKDIRCANAYLDERTKGPLLTDYLPIHKEK